MKVVLIEDSSFQRNVIKKLLEKFKVEVVEFPDAIFAMKDILKLDFDLVITDLNMPAMNGLELIMKLSNHGLKVPCLLLTAEEEAIEIDRNKYPYLLGVMKKPQVTSVSLDQVLSLINARS